MLSRSNRRELALALAFAPALVAASNPCDIYASGNTPCVAAHSTTRALYAAYNGPLYQVLRNSDSATTLIYPLTAGGVADAAAQDSFCANTTCLINAIYDQSPNQNTISRAPPGGETAGPQSNGYDNLAAADGAPVTLNGKKAYGVFISPGTGYRNDSTTNIATGNAAQGIYAVVDGTHYNGACCFDYGNAETSAHNTGDGHMQAVYFGTCTVWGTGNGNGPWVMADLENGLFSTSSIAQNTNDPTQTNRFVTGIVKGNTNNNWAIKGGNAASGGLTTYFNGVRPSGYNPMHQEGAILLGIGGDNSDGSQGTFYEGVMTSGFPSDATESSVQANVVAAKYATTSLVSGPAVSVGSTVTMRVTTPGYNTRYIFHNGTKVVTEVITSSSSTALQQAAMFKVVTGLGQSQCVSFESVDTPGSYIRHYAFELYVESGSGQQFNEDATFCPQAALNGQGNSIRSWSYPTRYFRNYYDVMYIASEGGPEAFDNTNSYNNDVSYVLGSGFLS